MRRTKRFMPISASSGTIEDMLGAFEEKLDDIGGSTKIQAGYDPIYEDVGGEFGEPGERYRYSEIQDMWEQEKSSDPVLLEYDGDFDAWWNDTRENLKEVSDDIEGCGSVQASTIDDMLVAFEDKLDSLGASTKITGSSDMDEKIWDIANRYTTSSPVSGSWDTEPAHLLKTLIEEVGLTEDQAKSVMIDHLGWDRDEVINLKPLQSSTSVQAAESTSDLGDDYIKSLMDSVSKKLKSFNTEYTLDDEKNNILLTSVSPEDIIVEYTIPLKDLKGNLDTDSRYILDAVEES